MLSNGSERFYRPLQKFDRDICIDNSVLAARYAGDFQIFSRFRDRDVSKIAEIIWLVFSAASPDTTPRCDAWRGGRGCFLLLTPPAAFYERQLGDIWLKVLALNQRQTGRNCVFFNPSAVKTGDTGKSAPPAFCAFSSV